MPNSIAKVFGSTIVRLLSPEYACTRLNVVVLSVIPASIVRPAFIFGYDSPHNGVLGIKKIKTDWISHRLDKDYGRDHKKPTFMEDRVKEREGEILRVILRNGHFGVAHQALAIAVRIDRKSLRPYIKRLSEKKLIWRSSGKQGKYFPTEEGYKDTRLNAYLIAEGYRSNILKEDKAIILNNREQTYPNYINFTTYTKYFRPKSTENDLLEALLFELSNRIGGFVIYILIQGMNPNNIGKIIMSKEKSIEEDSLVDEWIQKAISSVIPFLGRNFKDSIYKALGRFPTSYEKHIKYMDKRPFLKFDKKTANELDNAFAELYPLLYHELKRIVTELPRKIS